MNEVQILDAWCKQIRNKIDKLKTKKRHMENSFQINKTKYKIYEDNYDLKKEFQSESSRLFEECQRIKKEIKLDEREIRKYELLLFKIENKIQSS